MKLGSCAGVDGGAVVGEAFEDLFGGLVPDERGGVLVPGGDPGQDVGGEFFDVAVGGALQFLGGERGEPPFHQVHPRPVGRREMEVEPAVAQQPRCTVGVLWVDEVVQDDVHVELGGDLAVDLVQEGDEVGAGVAGADVGDDLAGGDVQGGEQIAGAVALIVVGGPRRCGGQHRQGRGGPVERLDLGFLVDREHRGGDRRVHVQADQVADLLHQVAGRATP